MKGAHSGRLINKSRSGRAGRARTCTNTQPERETLLIRAAVREPNTNPETARFVYDNVWLTHATPAGRVAPASWRRRSHAARSTGSLFDFWKCDDKVPGGGGSSGSDDDQLVLLATLNFRHHRRRRTLEQEQQQLQQQQRATTTTAESEIETHYESQMKSPVRVHVRVRVWRRCESVSALQMQWHEIVKLSPRSRVSQ